MRSLPAYLNEVRLRDHKGDADLPRVFVTKISLNPITGMYRYDEGLKEAAEYMAQGHRDCVVGVEDENGNTMGIIRCEGSGSETQLVPYKDGKKIDTYHLSKGDNKNTITMLLSSCLSQILYR